MATLGRLYDFTPGQLIVSQQVDDEFNQIVDLLNGTSTNRSIIVMFDHITDAPIVVDQNGAGILGEWRVNGSQKARINNNGAIRTINQFISTLATGTKPLDVASTTLCTNLNADLLDGVNGDSFLRSDAADVMSASDATSLLDLNQTGAGAVARFQVSGSTLVSINHSGQVVSAVTTGTAPFTVASTTVVTNLNADLLDGLSSGVFVRNDTASQTITGDLTISGSAPILTLTDTTGGDDDFSIGGNADVLTIKIVGGANLMTLGSGGNAITGNLTLNNDLTVVGVSAFSDDVTIDTQLKVNTSVAFGANNRLLVNHSETAQTDASVSFRASNTGHTPLDLVTEASASNPAFRIWEDNDATLRFRISSDGKIETRAGNGSTPSTSFLTVGGLYESLITQVGNVGTGTDDLMTKTIEANVMGEDGDYMEVFMAGSTANNTDSKTIQTSFAGTLTYASSAETTNFQNVFWRVYMRITRTSSTTADIWTEFIATGAGDQIIKVHQAFAKKALAVTWSNTNIVKATGASGTATNNNITQEVMVIKKFTNQ